MIYGSVCSGIEAATQAWHPLGWSPAFFSEIEKFPSAVLAHHYGSNMPGDDFTGNGVPNYGDMTKFKEWPDHAIDLLVGGTPCQSFSVAGLRKGMADPRGNLALTYLAIADRYRPKWLVWENVPGVLSSNTGRDFGAFLGALGQLGYGFAYRVLDAQFVRTRRFSRAVPQRRRRVFVVGYLGDWRRAAAVLFERESLSGNPPPRRIAGQGVAPTISARPSDGSGADFELGGGLIPARLSGHSDYSADVPTLRAAGGDAAGGSEALIPAVAPTIRAGGNKTGGHRPPGTDVDTCETLIPTYSPALKARDHKGPSSDGDGDGDGAPILPVFGFNARQDPDAWEGRTGPLDVDGGTQAIAIQERAACENPKAGPDGAGIRVDGAAYTMEARAVPQSVAFAQNQRDEVRIVTAAGALAAQPGTKQQTYLAQSVAFDLRGREGGAMPEGPHNTAAIRAASGGSSRSYVAQPMAVRRLTPIECERLQGFPDDFTQIPWRGKDAGACPDGPRYKALGNSMAVNVMAWIGGRIELVDFEMAERSRPFGEEVDGQIEAIIGG